MNEYIIIIRMTILAISIILCILDLANAICSTRGDSYMIVEGSVATDYYAFIKHSYESFYYNSGSNYLNDCYYYAYSPGQSTYHAWFRLDRFNIKQFSCPIDDKMKENTFTLDLSPAVSVSSQAAWLNSYFNGFYNSFEGCVVSIQFLPDTVNGVFVRSFTIHTIKRHLNENSLPVTEFFAVNQIVTTVSSSNFNDYEDKYGCSCTSGLLYYVSPLKKFAYIQEQHSTIYWAIQNYALDGTETDSDPCNTNYVSTTNTSLVTLFQISPPYNDNQYAHCQNEAFYDIGTTATIYTKYAYYFMQVYYQIHTYHYCCWYSCENTLPTFLYKMDLTTGAQTLIWNYYTGGFGQVAHIADFGLALTKNDATGYFLAPINSATGDLSSPIYQADSSTNWKFLQTRLGIDGTRPLFGVASNNVYTIQRITTQRETVFTATGHDFYNYASDVGGLNLMVVYPGSSCITYTPQTGDGTNIKVIIFKIETGAIVGCRLDLTNCNDNDFKGNAAMNSGEGCDDGNLNSGDGCSSTLVIEDGYRCANTGKTRSLCTRTKCGNNYMDEAAPENEKCDDGNLIGTDGCDKYCQITPGWFCPWPSQLCYKVCPDGVLNNIPGKPDNWYAYNTEICDEGAGHETAGCTNFCKSITSGWECPVVGQSCRTICGNHLLDPPTTPRIVYTEQCDLGTASNNGAAGCTSTCQVVQHWECPSPTVSCRPLCGNGNWDVIASGSPGGPHSESCDDGNTNSGDGCNSGCGWESVTRTQDFGYRNYYITNEVQYSNWVANYKEACVNLYGAYNTGNSTLPNYNFPNLLTFVFAEVFSIKRYCYTGVFCDECARARWPGYPLIHKAPNPNEMAFQAHPSRGRFFFIEDPTNGGFAATFIYNDKTFYWQSQTASKFPTMLQHNGIGSVRLSVGKYYFENNKERGLIIKRLDVVAGQSTLVEVCKIETTELDFGLPPLQGSDFFIWWPNYNLLLSRQFNGRQMDIMKFTSSFGSSNNNISCKSSELMTVKYYFSDISGELNVYPVFMKVLTETKMFIYRKTKSNKEVISYLISIYEWYPETGVIYEEDVKDIGEEVWDMVAFESDVLITTPTKTRSINYNPSTKVYTLADVTLVIQSGTTGKKWRFFQKRPDPDDPTTNPTVYGYYIEEYYHKNLFHPTVYASGAFKVNDNSVFTLPIRYHTSGTPGLDQFELNFNLGYLLINPFDVGTKYMGILQLHNCANNKPTHKLDFWEEISLGVFNLQTQAIVTCVDLTSTLGLNMTNKIE